MIKEWFTAREFAELNLKGMPKTERAYRFRADKENWKSRHRNKGKGYEYHISNIPDQAQIELLEKSIGTKALQTMGSGYEGIKSQENSQKTATPEDMRNARILIVALFDRFVTSTGMGISASEQPFLKFYAAEGRNPASSLVPDWVYRIYPSFSVPSLRNWRKIRKQPNALQEFTARYGNRKGTGILERAEDGDVSAYIAALITHNGHLSAGHIRDMVRLKFGKTLSVNNSKTGEKEAKPLPKIRAFERFIASWKKENSDVILKITDPDGYKNKCRFAVGRADEGINNLNQLWEIDASPVDALCIDGRYNLYAIIDIFSRRAMFSISRTPRTEASLALIRRAILEWGVPDRLKTDNGSDFVSHRFQTAILGLGIEQDICPPFSPEKKPHVERVIGTLQREVMPVLPGFVGHNVADRKKIEARKSFAERLGETDDKAFAIQMNAQELQKYVDMWANDKYANRVHSTLGVSPNEKANSWHGAIRKIENERALDMLLAPIASGKGFRTVTKHGISVERAKFIAPELTLYIGQEVFVRHDNTDMGRIYVFDENEKFICKAINPDRLGIDRQDAAREMKKAQSEYINQRTKELRNVSSKFKPEDFIEATLKSDIDKSPDVIEFPRQTLPHRTAALEEASFATQEKKIPEHTPLTERQKAAHEKLVAQLSAPQQSEVIEINTRETRYSRACSLEDRLNKGSRISENDFRWLEGYRETPEYRSQKSMAEKFGNNWFNKES